MANDAYAHIEPNSTREVLIKRVDGLWYWSVKPNRWWLFTTQPANKADAIATCAKLGSHATVVTSITLNEGVR